MLEERKHQHDSYLKSEGSTSDNDSGLGSCNSHTMLMDKSGEAKEEERQRDQEGCRMRMEAKRHQTHWEEEALTYVHEEVVSPDMSSARVKTWPSVFSPLPQYSSGPLDQPNSLGMVKQHCLSDSVFLAGSTSSYLAQPCHGTKEDLESSYWEICLSNKQPHLQHPQKLTPHQTRSDLNISSTGHNQAAVCLQSPTLRPTEYVEVQRVNEEDMVLLQSVASGRGRGDGCSQMYQGEYYSKVKGVQHDNTLLLQSKVTEEEVNRCSCDDQETNGATDICYTSSIGTTTQKPTDCIRMAKPVQNQTVLATSGYVDTAAMFTLPTY